MEAPSTPTRAAVYSQIRRDNEVEARELLHDRLTEAGRSIGATFETRGDFNLTTKVLAMALLHFDPDAQISTLTSIPTSSLEYNQLRRANERETCNRLRQKIPGRILEQPFMTFSNFNPTTKIVVAAAKYLDEFEAGRISPLRQEFGIDEQMHHPTYRLRRPHRSSSSAVESPASLETPDLPNFSMLSRQTTVPDSDDEEVPYLLPPPPRGGFVMDTDRQSNVRRSARERVFADIDVHDLQHEYDHKSPEVQAIKKKQSKSPGKNNGTTRSWELTGPQTPWEEQKVEKHPVEKIQQLEQVAKRLVAKAKEMIEPAEDTNRREYAVERDDLAIAHEKDIEWITDLMIDAITVIESKEEKRRKMKKWAVEQAKWAEEHVLQ
ncbi:hypothetical protein LTR24_005994 [Lithohypha guttulata]|uniref:Uncharacterized protein n=1 Tax=Lithohypha guttulata TaxID=1690604 RepID=A0ABR0K7K0_9EURO|nr:hypothetical protein LTR24_005994 [Lithohypha guttulata]